MIKDERGVALLIAIIVSVLLVLMGLSVTFTSMTDFSISNELENKKKAFLVTSAGYNVTKNFLMERVINDELANVTVVNYYMTYPTLTGVPKNYFDRNPLWPKEAMSIDFDNPPTPSGTRNVKGLLTPAAGTTLSTGGRYWAKLTDNDDGDGDMDKDSDGRVYLRVMGVHKVPPGQLSTYGSNVNNSMAVIEAIIERDKTLNMSASFSTYGLDIDAASWGEMWDQNPASGHFLYVDGYDHDDMTLVELVTEWTNGWTPANVPQHGPNHDTSCTTPTAGIETLGTNPGDGLAQLDEMYDDLQAVGEGIENQILGCLTEPGPHTSSYGGPFNWANPPSMRDVTDETAADPDRTEIFDPDYVMGLVNYLAGKADVTVAANGDLPASIGTDAAPQVTYCVDRCEVPVDTSGAGLLLVMNRLHFDADFNFRGLVMVIGGPAEFHTEQGHSVNVLGGLFVADLECNPTCAYDGNGGPRISVGRGRHRFYYSGSGLELGYSFLPMNIVSWREVTPEIEPWF